MLATADILKSFLVTSSSFVVCNTATGTHLNECTCCLRLDYSMYDVASSLALLFTTADSFSFLLIDDVTADLVHIVPAGSIRSSWFNTFLLVILAPWCTSRFIIPFDVPAGPPSTLALAAGSTWPPPDYEQLTQLWTSPLLIQLPFTMMNQPNAELHLENHRLDRFCYCSSSSSI
ncbi:hypothetical protein F511_36727 [Dorcoceras hygrometricum]|uniref:Uncharacterized protein n=1 Tax=Dorcoceras hygrometricum TaxID=472368 RepID=A0A2Z7B5A7_9LAMI|nr:hypothetical protein F511_36727 [Dorcoceras hygrometricum]